MRKIRNIIIGMIISCLFVSVIPINAFAQEISEEQVEDNLEKELDPGEGRLSGQYVPKEFYSDDYSKARSIESVTHNSKFNEGYTIKKGIDVSRWQGTIDWEKVKADGIEFAFIRIGARGYGDAGIFTDPDAMYEANLQGAIAAGIPVGAYIFSQALNEEEAVEEAQYVLDRVKGYNIELPIVMDYEYASTSAGNVGRLYNAKLSKAEATANCLAFCEHVENAGYRAMVYANSSFLSNQLNPDDISEKYMIWLAQYASEAEYDGDYDFWQYTDAGSVSGIDGNVDMDFWYIPESEITTVVLTVTNTTTSSVSLEWTKTEGASGYELYRAKGSEDTSLIKVFESNEELTYTDEGLQSGTSYSYKIRPYYLKEDGTVKYGEFSSVKNGVTVVAKTTLSKETAFDAIKLSWKKVNGADGYQLQRYNSSTKKYSTLKTITNGSTVTYTNTSLNASTTYKYRIRAYKTVGGTKVYGDYSDVLSVKTNGSVKGKVNAKNVSVRSGAGTSYKKLTTVTKNKVLKVTGSNGSWYRISISSSGKTKTAYIAKKYVTLTTTTIKAPGKPTLTAKATSFYKIKLTWKKVSGASGYQVQRYNSSKKKYETIKTITSGSTVAYTNGSLNASTTYKYRIRAYKTLGSEKKYGSYSAVKSAKTQAAKKAKINASSVNIRKGAGTSYAVLKTLKKGTKITLTGSRGDWYRTSVTVSGKKRTGYVLKKYVTFL